MKRNKYNSFHPQIGDLCVDMAAISMNKHQESICGDYYTIAEEGNRHVLVLSDGLGSGVKANILATLTAKMLSTMIANSIPSEEAVRAVARTLPVCKVRGLAYSTFTVLCMEEDEAELLQFDNPDAILIRNGSVYDYPVRSMQVDDKTIHVSKFRIHEDDMLLIMSDGVTNAGVGKTTYGGWGREDLVRCCRKWYKPGMTARDMAGAVADAGYALNLEDTVDDMTVLALSFIKPRVVNLMIGPPRNREADAQYLKNFFDREGMHVICGGTTAKLAADYLDEVVIPLEETMTPEVPAMMELAGVDLVTEGLLTLERLVDLAEECQIHSLQFIAQSRQKDGASKLGDMLFNYATHINLFFGNAQNEGYAGLDISKRSKQETVEILMDHLRNAGKEVEIISWAI